MKPQSNARNAFHPLRLYYQGITTNNALEAIKCLSRRLISLCTL